MIVIAEPYFRFARTVDAQDLREHATRLLGASEETVRSYDGYVRLLERLGEGAELHVSVRLEQGSTKGWITITTLVTAITFYGNIRQSLDYIVHDAKVIGRILVARAPENLGMVDARPETRQLRAGQAGRLKKLFDQVERGDLSAEEATRRAMKILYEHAGADLPPGLGERLSAELQDAEPMEGKRRQRLPQRTHQVDFALLPETPRRRRIGVIARRDPKGGRLRIETY